MLNGRRPFTILLVQNEHEQAGHATNERVVNELRQRYWMTLLRPTVRAIAQKRYGAIFTSLPIPSSWHYDRLQVRICTTTNALRLSCARRIEVGSLYYRNTEPLRVSTGVLFHRGHRLWEERGND
ncbi:hypothetical protein EVAR_11464_1 [Eumeta japonica]|uniref:Uncharacterized protein n=1 Tax=Eumeta variegata TaxID=151549 RepID=A0A4C1TN45_EUMVA|nr:hypothetical protein EVAR_11464_1 [Eumeta japonica]